MLHAPVHLHQLRHLDGRRRLVRHAGQQGQVGAFVGSTRLARPAQEHADQLRPFGTLAEQRHQQVRRLVPGQLDTFAPCQRGRVSRHDPRHDLSRRRRPGRGSQDKALSVANRQRGPLILHEPGRAFDEIGGNLADTQAGAHAAAKGSQLGLEIDPLAVGRLVDAPLQEAVGRQQEQCRHERQ